MLKPTSLVRRAIRMDFVSVSGGGVGQEEEESMKDVNVIEVLIVLVFIYCMFHVNWHAWS
jgi:hypothetical protein